MEVMVLDDKKLIVRDVVRCVEKIVDGANCNGFSDEYEALEFARNNSIDVAIMDIDMPNMNGIDMAKILINLKPNINIIFLTGHKQYALDSYKVLASGFLLKPVDENELKKVMNNLRHPVRENNELDAEKISANITKYRKNINMSIEKLAQQMNCSYQTVYRWEKGDRTPDLFALVDVAKILNVSIDDLLS